MCQTGIVPVQLFFSQMPWNLFIMHVIARVSHFKIEIEAGIKLREMYSSRSGLALFEFVLVPRI